MYTYRFMRRHLTKRHLRVHSKRFLAREPRDHTDVSSFGLKGVCEMKPLDVTPLSVDFNQPSGFRSVPAQVSITSFGQTVDRSHGVEHPHPVSVTPAIQAAPPAQVR